MKIDLSYFELLQIASSLHLVSSVYGTVEEDFIKRIDFILDSFDNLGTVST